MADTGLKSLGKSDKYREAWEVWEIWEVSGSLRSMGAVVGILAAAGVSYTAIVTVGVWW